jgi:HlyD family secretion protein
VGSASPVADKKEPVPEKGQRKASDGKTMDGDRDELEVLYVVDANKVHAEPVTTGVSDETYVEIKSGAKEGESVVKGPYRVLRRLKVGYRVVKKDESEMNDAASGGESSSKEEID